MTPPTIEFEPQAKTCLDASVPNGLELENDEPPPRIPRYGGDATNAMRRRAREHFGNAARGATSLDEGLFAAQQALKGPVKTKRRPLASLDPIA